jgi:hypothetical protein
MNRPPLEVADIVRYAGQSFVERNRKWITGQHQKVLLAITRCRTERLLVFADPRMGQDRLSERKNS